MRRRLIAGNWKMYKTPAETRVFFQAFKPAAADVGHCDILICTPFVNLAAAIEEANGANLAIGAQNLYWGSEGAFTGEISGPMLKAAGCSYVIIGHSERRQYFGENDATVLRKIQAALDSDLTPIVCLGERLDERESGRTEEVLQRQFDHGIAPLSAEQFGRIVIAYEPVWAIGTGRTATPQVAAEAHGFIRSRIARKFGDAPAGSTRILYGGSVKPDNMKDLIAEEEIDGALVGGASLDPEAFAVIVNTK